VRYKTKISGLREWRRRERVREDKMVAECGKNNVRRERKRLRDLRKCRGFFHKAR
jgi:hypothetical protein